MQDRRREERAAQPQQEVRALEVPQADKEEARRAAEAELAKLREEMEERQLVDKGLEALQPQAMERPRVPAVAVARLREADEHRESDTVSEELILADSPLYSIPIYKPGNLGNI